MKHKYHVCNIVDACTTVKTNFDLVYRDQFPQIRLVICREKEEPS